MTMLTTNRPSFLTGLVLLFVTWATFVHLGDFPLLSPDEGRNAEVAREMKVSGSWLVPTYDGATYLDKPAFFFKASALALQAFGDTEWAARLPSAVAAWLWLMMLFMFCRKTYGEVTAALAVVVVVLTPLFQAFGRIVIFDMMLGFFVSLSILAAYLAAQHEGSGRRSWYLLATVAAGIATLVKGPVGFLVPFFVMALFHGVSGRWRMVGSFFRLSHILLFLAVVLPWFVGLSLACPDFPYYGIMKESIARFTTPEFRRTQPFYYYGLIIATCFFPFSLMLPAALREAVRKSFRFQESDRLFLVWAVVVVVFFSLSQSKLPGYILTGVVALGVLVARVLAEALTRADETASRVLARSTLLLGVVAFGLALAPLMEWWQPDWLPHPRWLTPIVLERFAPMLPWIGFTFLVTAGIGIVAWLTQSQRLQVLAFLVFPILFLSVNFELVSRHAGIKSAQPLKAHLPQGLPEDTEFACLACMPHGLPFYLRKEMTVFTEDGHELTSNYVLFSIKTGKPWSDRLIPLDRYPGYLSGRQHPIYLMARTERLAEITAIAQGKVIAALPGDYIGVLLERPEH
jgi:4-amino-4-deoxy-L-arabinose transferase-like glycosyltransferase